MAPPKHVIDFFIITERQRDRESDSAMQWLLPMLVTQTSAWEEEEKEFPRYFLQTKGRKKSTKDMNLYEYFTR